MPELHALESSSTSQTRAIWWTASPKRETVWPPQSVANGRFRRAPSRSMAGQSMGASTVCGWGITAHKVDMLVCLTCGYVLLFYQGSTIFDFD